MCWKHSVIIASTLASLFPSFALLADPAEVVSAQLRENNGTWQVSVTVRHGDTGWDHYADAWRVLDGEGRVLGERILHHPHVQEQPFTRSLSGVEIPKGTTAVFIQARDNQSGWSPQTLEVGLGR